MAPHPQPHPAVVKRPIGYQVTSTWCRECAPEGVSDSYPPLREGDDHGVPYRCDICDRPLTPCEHEFGEWRPWWCGGEFRICDKDACGETEHRDAQTHEPIARPRGILPDATAGERSCSG